MAVAVGVVEDRLVQRRRAGKHRDPFSVDALQQAVDVEDRLGEHRGAGGDRSEDACLQPEHVEVGVDHEVAVVRTKPGHRHPVGGHLHGAAVGLHDPLRRSGGPRRKEDVRHVVIGNFHSSGGLPTEGADVRHDGFEIRKCFVLQHARVVDAEEVGDGDEPAHPRPAQDARRLSPLETRVDRDERGARLPQTERRDYPVGTVGSPDRHAIARIDAGAEAPGCLVQLRVGELRVTVDDRHALAEPVNGAAEERRDGHPLRIVEDSSRRWRV